MHIEYEHRFGFPEPNPVEAITPRPPMEDHVIPTDQTWASICDTIRCF